MHNPFHLQPAAEDVHDELSMQLEQPALHASVHSEPVHPHMAGDASHDLLSPQLLHPALHSLVMHVK